MHGISPLPWLYSMTDLFTWLQVDHLQARPGPCPVNVHSGIQYILFVQDPDGYVLYKDMITSPRFTSSLYHLVQ